MKEINIDSNGRNLEGRLRLPKNAEKGIVVAHSFRNTMDELICLDASQKFFQMGFAVLSFNFLGHGKSEGSLRDVSYFSTAENIFSAIRYLKSKEIKKIGVYAISLGAIATVLSKEQPDAQVFLSPSPLYNPKGLYERYAQEIDQQKDRLNAEGYAVVTSGSGRGQFEISEKWISEMKRLQSKVHRNHKKDKIPTLIIQGTEDELSNIGFAEKFAEENGNGFELVPGADHNFTKFHHREIAIRSALEFFEYCLR